MFLLDSGFAMIEVLVYNHSDEQRACMVRGGLVVVKVVVAKTLILIFSVTPVFAVTWTGARAAKGDGL